MRKVAILFVVFFGMAVTCRAQQTLVQATIVDPMGNPYTFGTGSASLVCPGNQAPTHNGTTVIRNYPTVGLDGNAHFQQALYDVNQLDQSGCAYRWTITWKDGVTTFIATNVGAAGSGTPITGPGPVNISAPINAFAVPLPNQGTSVGPALQTNGVPNTTQNVLNLKTGANAVLTADAIGGVTIAVPNCVFGSPISSFTTNSQNRLNSFYGPPKCTFANQVETSGSIGPPNITEIESAGTAAEYTGIVSYSVGIQPMGVTNTLGQVGIYGWAVQEGNGNNVALTGTAGRIGIAGNGTYTNVYGVRSINDIGNITSTGTVTNSYGVFAGEQHLYSGTLHNKIGFSSFDLNFMGTQAADTFNAVFYTGTQTTCSTCWDFYGSNKSQFGTINGTSLLVTGVKDGLVPAAPTTANACTLGTASAGCLGAFLTGYSFNQNATAAQAVTYTLPTAAAGKQYCVSNSYNGSAANTGVLTIATSAAGQFIIFTDGSLSASGGNVTSGGAGGDSACAIGVDATHWQLFVENGTWTKH